MILSPVIRQYFYDSNGNPLIGGQLFSYIAGTTTPQATYTDQSGGTPNSNPVILDSSGGANVWMDPTLAYKFILKDALSNLLWTVDQVSSAGLTGAPGWNSNSNYSQGNIVADSSGSGLFYVSLTSNNLGNALTSVANWRMLGGMIRTLTSSQNALATDELIHSSSTIGAITITLPVCATTPIGKRITIKDIGNGGFTTTIAGGGISDTVDGASTYATVLRRYEAITVENTGSTWDVVQGFLVQDGSVSTAKIAASAVTTAKIADANVTQAKLAARSTGTSVAAGGVAVGVGSLTNGTSTTAVSISGLGGTIVTTGRPVMIFLQNDGSGSAAQVETSSSTTSPIQSTFILLRDSVEIGRWVFSLTVTANPAGGGLPAGCISMVDIVAAGSHVYQLQYLVRSGCRADVVNTSLIMYEI